MVEAEVACSARGKVLGRQVRAGAEPDSLFLMVGFRGTPSAVRSCTLTRPGFSQSLGWVFRGCKSGKSTRQLPCPTLRTPTAAPA